MRKKSAEKVKRTKRTKRTSRSRKQVIVRKKISQIITWMGIVIIGILVIPTGGLIALISVIWSAVDKIAEWIGNEK